MSRLLTARQVAEQLGVHPGTILTWTRNGDLPGVRLPSGALRYPEEALDEWLAARTTPRGDVAKDHQRGADLAARPNKKLKSVVRKDRRFEVVETPPKETNDAC